MNHVSPGALVISLDFELFWGMRDKVTLDQYMANLAGVRKAIPLLLDVFSEFKVSATWATVGLLFSGDKDSLVRSCPKVEPGYLDVNLNPYPHLEKIGDNEDEDVFHYAQSLLNLIKKYPGQEIGTHTFSHFYCIEQGQTLETFRADLQAAIDVGRREGVEIKSLVFPRNQYNESYLKMCKELGITSFRGNEKSWVYSPKEESNKSYIQRGVRLMDSYFNLTGYHANSLDKIKKSQPYNIPSSMFLRPYSHKLKILEPLRLRRIKNGIKSAARNGLVYHLWWHPHNFGTNIDQNINMIRQILEFYKTIKKEYGMKSVTMNDVAKIISKDCGL